MNEDVPVPVQWGGDFLGSMPTGGFQRVTVAGHVFSFPTSQSIRRLGKIASETFSDGEGKYLSAANRVADCVTLAEDHLERAQNARKHGRSEEEKEWAKTLHIQLESAEERWNTIEPLTRMRLREVGVAM